MTDQRLIKELQAITAVLTQIRDQIHGLSSEVRETTKATHEVTSDDNAVVQLATRIPKTLYQRLKLFSVEHEVSIADLVAEAIEHVCKKHKG